MIINCRSIADNILKTQKKRITNLNYTPTLTMVGLEGEKDDFHYFISGVHKACDEVGIKLVVHRVPVNKLAGILSDLGYVRTHGIILQNNIDKITGDSRFSYMIPYKKDIDCTTFRNIANFYENKKPLFIPTTAEAVITAIESVDEGVTPIVDSEIVVIGRGPVGRTVATLLTQKGAAVTILHTQINPANINHISSNADAIVSCVGRPVVNESMIGDDTSIIIDAGLGDIEKDTYEWLAESEYKYVTPSKGGLGFITSALITKHLIDACERNKEEG